MEFRKKMEETNQHRKKLSKRKNKMRMDNKPQIERAEKYKEKIRQGHREQG
jgi:hypothetical protein